MPKEIKTYTVELTARDIDLLEEALYARSALLYAMGDQAFSRNNVQEANGFDARARIIEDLALKVSLPIDKAYIKSYNLVKPKAKQGEEQVTNEQIEESVQQGGTLVS